MTRWAITQAMFANVNFRERDSSGRAIDEPFTAQDFLGSGNRGRRAIESQKEKLELAMVTANLAKIQPGTPATDDIPEWALGEYHG